MPEMLVREKSTTWKIKDKAEGGDGRTICGYASTFEGVDNPDSYGEIINPKAYDNTVARHKAGELKVKMLNNHGEPIGLWHVLEVTDKGLWAEGRVSAIDTGDKVLELVKDEVIDSLSVSFFSRTYRELDDRYRGWRIVEHMEVELREISPVTWPANKEAKIAETRSEMGIKNARPASEDFDFSLIRKSNEICAQIIGSLLED